MDNMIVMETKRIHSDEDLEAVIEGLKDFAVIRIDLDGLISSWNSGAKKMMGYDVSEVVGKPADIIFTLADRKAKKAEEEMSIAIEKGSSVDERWHVRKDGTIFWGSGLMTSLYDEAKRPKGFVKIFRDMSEQRRLTESLLRSNRDLEQFAHTVSHDLQEPLRVIAGYADLLKARYSGKLDTDADHYIEALASGAGRAQKMIRALLMVSRSDAPNGKYEEINFETLIKDVIKNLQFLIEERNAQIKFTSLPVLAANPEQMLQLFQNLMSNAIKYNRAERPQVFIRADETPKDWIFSVEDNGIGMAAADLDMIFNLFARLDTESEGSGIGLSICKRIVESYGGRIWVKSEKEKGSIFYFSVPKT